MIQYIEIDKKKAFYADMALILGAILWGGEYIAIKYALREFSPLYINVFRFGLGSIITAIIFIKNTKMIKKEYIKGGAFLGLFSFIGFALMTIAMQYISVAVNAFLVATYTIWVPVFSIVIYKRRPSWIILCSAFMCMIGIYFLTFRGDLELGFGGLLSLLAAIAFSFCIILKEYYVKRLDPIAVTIAQNGSTAIYYIIAALIFDEIPTYTGHAESLWAIVYMILGATVIAHVIVGISMKYTTATRQVIVISLESVFASIFGLLLLKEALTISVLWGAVFIFSAIIMVETELKFIPFFRKSKNEKTE